MSGGWESGDGGAEGETSVVAAVIVAEDQAREFFAKRGWRLVEEPAFREVDGEIAATGETDFSIFKSVQTTDDECRRGWAIYLGTSPGDDPQLWDLYVKAGEVSLGRYAEAA